MLFILGYGSKIFNVAICILKKIQFCYFSYLVVFLLNSSPINPQNIFLKLLSERGENFLVNPSLRDHSTLS